MVKKRQSNRIRLSKDDRVFTIFADLILLLIFLIVLYPLIFTLSSSFSSARAVSSGKVYLWPVDFSLEGYKTVFEYDMVLAGYGNTIFYALAGTMINVSLTMIAAYSLARKGLPLRGLFMFLFTLLCSLTAV
jgi:putative aldouronate transport system permease protein